MNKNKKEFGLSNEDDKNLSYKEIFENILKERR